VVSIQVWSNLLAPPREPGRGALSPRLGAFGGVSIKGVALLVRRDIAGVLVDVTDADIVEVAGFVPARTMN
jgi:hypothetical protein